MKRLLLSFFIFLTLLGTAQDTLNRKRLNTVLISGVAIYTGSIVVLNSAWYANQLRSPFHWFNDNKQWLQVDKVGHAFTAYQISRVSTTSFQWAGMSDFKSHLYGTLCGVLYQTPIEIMDGFASGYGASWGDLMANTAGSFFWLGQYLLWKEERVHFKYSFHSTSYANLRPNVLGDGWSQEWLKDYNGQTYWLSFDLYALANKSKWTPHWLNLAVGYGAEGMVFAHNEENEQAGYGPKRQFYLALDFDFSHFKSKSKLLNSFLYVFDMIKLPMPTIEVDGDGCFKFYPAYF